MHKINNAQSLSLDILRIFAVQLVVVGHALPYFNIGRANYIQNSAVVLFFVLSGIVIVYSVLNKIILDSGYGFKEYFIDRFSRIYSGLIPSLLFIFLLDFCQVYILGNKSYLYTNAFDLKTFLGNLLMLQDFPKFDFGLTSFGSGRPLWTLSIEWWLYMFFGLLVLNFTKKFDFKMLPLLIFFMIVPFYNAFGGRGVSLTLFWLEGALISYLIFKYNANVKKSLSIFFIVIFSILIYKRLSLTKEAYDLVYVTLISFLIFFTLQFLSYIKYEAEKIKVIVRTVSGYSFTLYLIHYSIFDFVAYFNQKNESLSVFFLSIIISNFIAFIIAYFTEMRYKEFRNILIKYTIKGKKC